MEKNVELSDEILENVNAGIDVNGGDTSKYSLDGSPVNRYDDDYSFDVYGKDCGYDQLALIP